MAALGIKDLEPLERRYSRCYYEMEVKSRIGLPRCR